MVPGGSASSLSGWRVSDGEFCRHSTFFFVPELNLRTYVECEGKPGIWFFSLDADSWPVVFGGRHLYGLPYFSARMQQTSSDDGCFFSSARRAGGARFVARYRPLGDVFFPEPGTFEHWAAERYCCILIRGEAAWRASKFITRRGRSKKRTWRSTHAASFRRRD